VSGGSSGNNAISVEKGMVRFEGGVVLGNTGTNPQIQVINHGDVIVEGGTVLTIAGSGSSLAFASTGGVIQLDQAAIQWAANSSYPSGTLSGNIGGTITANGTSFQPLGFTITAPFNVTCASGGVVYTGGGLAGVPGTNTQSGCTISGNGQAN